VKRSGSKLKKPKFLNPTKAAEIYGFPRPTIYGWAAGRLFPIYYLGRSIYFTREDFEDFLESNRQGVGGEER